MTATQEFHEGRLRTAAEQATQAVKSKPTDVTARRILSEILCVTGDLDRADVQLDAMMQLEPKVAMDVALTRQLIRAEQARRQFFAEGRLPEFIDQPTADLKLRLEASILVRENKTAEAAEALHKAEAQRPRVAGECNGAAFDDLRDLDDFTAAFFEVLTSTGKYYWIPMPQVELIEFHPPVRIRDLLWRRAHMVVRGGPDGEVFLPALYAGSHASADEQVQLGRVTQWSDGDSGGNLGPPAPARGLGHRVLLAGEQDHPFMDLTRIEIAQSKDSA